MNDLKDQLIRLGYTHPELRDNLRPVLDRLHTASIRMEPEVADWWKRSRNVMNLFKALDRKGVEVPYEDVSKMEKELVTDLQQSLSTDGIIQPHMRGSATHKRVVKQSVDNILNYHGQWLEAFQNRYDREAARKILELYGFEVIHSVVNEWHKAADGYL